MTKRALAYLPDGQYDESIEDLDASEFPYGKSEDIPLNYLKKHEMESRRVQFVFQRFPFEHHHRLFEDP